jgi:hypothetical protein
MVFQVKKNAGPQLGDPANGFWSFSRKELFSYLENPGNACQLRGQIQRRSQMVEIQRNDQPAAGSGCHLVS